MRHEKKRYLMPMQLWFVIIVFLLLIFTAVAVGIIFLIMVAVGIVYDNDLISLLFYLLCASVIIGTLTASIFGMLVLRPYRKLNDATQEIASGNFDVRIELKGPKEVAQLAENFNIMAKELGSIETLRDDFISNVSHEFKTPVASIKGFAKLLKKDTISKENREEYLDVIIKESDRLAKLTGNVLLLAKLERQEITPAKNEYLLDEQLRQAILILEPEWKRKSIVISTNLENALFYGNEEMLIQVWINLIGNAIKFTPENGTITVSILKDSIGYSIEISDSGIGMNEDTINRMFDKFYQGDKSRSSEGNGLGLALVDRIVKMHEGKLTVTSSLGQGTTVHIVLPVSLNAL